MIKEDFVRSATVRRIIDGDTYEVLIDDGRQHYSVEQLRLLRMDTPEVRDETKEAGLEAKAFVQNILTVGKEIVIQTEKDDSFGRYLAEVYYQDENDQQQNLNDELFEKGFAKIYVKK